MRPAPAQLTHQDRMILRNALSDVPLFTDVQGRRTLIREAFGAYLTEDIEKTLRFVDWRVAHSRC